MLGDFLCRTQARYDLEDDLHVKYGQKCGLTHDIDINPKILFCSFFFPLNILL